LGVVIGPNLIDIAIKGIKGRLFTMKYITVTIAVKDKNRYASETNKGIEDAAFIVIEESEKKIQVANIESSNDGFGFT
jgi:hypothetical protein